MLRNPLSGPFHRTPHSFKKFTAHSTKLSAPPPQEPTNASVKGICSINARGSQVSQGHHQHRAARCNPAPPTPSHPLLSPNHQNSNQPRASGRLVWTPLLATGRPPANYTVKPTRCSAPEPTQLAHTDPEKPLPPTAARGARKPAYTKGAPAVIADRPGFAACCFLPTEVKHLLQVVRLGQGRAGLAGQLGACVGMQRTTCKCQGEPVMCSGSSCRPILEFILT